MRELRLSGMVSFLAVVLLSAGTLQGQTALELKEEELEKVRARERELVGEIESLKLASIIEDLQRAGYPEGGDGLEVVEHSGMVIGFSDKHKQAGWVFHMLIPDVSFGNVTRTNDFRPDPMLSEGSAVEEDYFVKRKMSDGEYEYDGFGFDRGHLAPSADFRWSGIALSESYYYSNMTPQRPGFNRESWAEVEDVLRTVVNKDPARYYVLTGPVLHDSLPVLERSINELSIPEYHYKIIADTRLESAKGLAFLMPNEKCEYPFDYYVVSIDSVEKLTGLDFFSGLPEELEERIESRSDFSEWETGKPRGDVAPLRTENLPEGLINTVEAGYHNGEKVSVAGKVVSTKFIPKSKSTFLNLDRAFPNQIFSVFIWKDALRNFSYKPDEFLQDKYIVVIGKIEKDKRGVPTITVKGERDIQLLENYKGDVR